MLSAQTIAIVKSTVPLLEGAGVAITNHFYQRMFQVNPELKDIFRPLPKVRSEILPESKCH